MRRREEGEGEGEGGMFSMTVAGTAVTREDISAERSAPVMEEERPDGDVRVASCQI